MPPLPIEILAHIFVQCLSDQPYVKPDADRAPLLFMRVCRHWREIALQTTQLWCSLSAVQYAWGMLQPMSGARFGGYAAWLSRSGNRPLSLAVPFEETTARKWSQEWVQLLLSYRGRFERLWVADERAVDLNEMVDGAHMLKLLAVQAQTLVSCRKDRVITHPLPCLRTLLLDSCNVGPAILPDAAWGNLTRLAVRLAEGRVYLVEEFLDLVSLCPNLQVLVFGPFFPERAWSAEAMPQPQPPRSHPNLRLLTLVLSGPEVFQPASPILILPALRSLRVQYDFEHDLEKAVTRKVGGAMTPPQRFLNIVAGRNEDFYLFDAGWMNITHLAVFFIGDLRVFSTVMELCPNLRVLEMKGHRCSDRSTSLPTPLLYPSLCELFIAVDAPLGNILEVATLPGLQSLTIESGDCGEHGNVRDMLLRSRCALEKLDVWDTGLHQTHSRIYWTEEERAELLESLPTLTEIELNPLAV